MIDLGLPRRVHIHYLRPPARTERFEQDLLYEDGAVKITLARDIELARPLEIGGEVVLDRGSDAVWFTFPGAWHDIGRFHRPDGTFTGIYANVLTPCVFEPGDDWHTTDLFLDLWLPAADGAREPIPGTAPRILDADELVHAETRGWVVPAEAERARREVDRLTELARLERWPPAMVQEWSRERALTLL